MSAEGRAPGTTGYSLHSYDDHRDEHRAEFERRFAQSVAGETANLVRSEGANRVVITADNRILGMLRNELHRSNGYDIKEVARDYSKFSVNELHEQLASLALIPPRRRPGYAS